MARSQDTPTDGVRRHGWSAFTPPSPQFAALIGSVAALLVSAMILFPWVLSPNSNKVLGLTDRNPASEWQRYVSTLAKALDAQCARDPVTPIIVSDSDAAFPDLLAMHALPACRIVRPTGATPMSADDVAAGIFVYERENNRAFTVPQNLTLTEADSPESGISFKKSESLHCTLLRSYSSTAGHFGFGEFRCKVA